MSLQAACGGCNWFIKGLLHWETILKSGLVSLCCDALVIQWEKGQFLCGVSPLFTLVRNTGATSMTVLPVNHVFHTKLTYPLHTWPETGFLLAAVAMDVVIEFVQNIWHTMTHKCQDDFSTLTPWENSNYAECYKSTYLLWNIFVVRIRSWLFAAKSFM